MCHRMYLKIEVLMLEITIFIRQQEIVGINFKIENLLFIL